MLQWRVGHAPPPRAAMLLEFDSVVGVHFDHMAREDFRKTIDANWNWLDGRSLI